MNKIFSAFVLPILLLVTPMSFAKSKKTQMAKISVDGAALYKAASFDSPVLDYLEKGRKVRISKKTYEGAGGLGVFYKVKVGKQIGFLVDTEVSAGDGLAAMMNDAAKNINGDVELPPMYLTRYIGGGLGMINYTDTYENRVVSSMVPVVTFKASGPKLFWGAPIDLELSHSLNVPEYFNDFSSLSTGFFIQMSAQILKPLIEHPKWQIYGAYGMMLNYETFALELQNDVYDAQEIRAGLKGMLGAAYRLGQWALKVEASYIFEETSYFSVGGYLQKSF